MFVITFVKKKLHVIIFGTWKDIQRDSSKIVHTGKLADMSQISNAKQNPFQT